MSLFDTGIRDGCTIHDYHQQSQIPEEERCEHCKGLGVVRWRCGGTGEGDYRVCFFCDGDGRKREKNVQAV